MDTSSNSLAQQVEMILERSRKIKYDDRMGLIIPKEISSNSNQMQKKEDFKISDPLSSETNAAKPEAQHSLLQEFKLKDIEARPFTLKIKQDMLIPSDMQSYTKTVDVDLINLASRYHNEIEKSKSMAYHQRLELEQLELRKNELQMKNSILEKKYQAESHALTERQISLTKVIFI